MPAVSSRPRILVVGAGPAGLSCALWLQRLQFDVTIIEAAQRAGGTPRQTPRPNRWVLGFPAIDAPALAERYVAHIREEGIPLLTQTALTAIERRAPSGFTVTLTGPAQTEPQVHPIDALVIATGTRWRDARDLDIDGATAAAASARLHCHPLDHLSPQPEWQQVAVLGGGDNAYCTALDLAESAGKVHLLQRSAPRAQTVFQTRLQALAAAGRVEIAPIGAITALAASNDGLRITRSDGHTLRVDQLFARLGFSPQTDFLVDAWAEARQLLDEAGFIPTDRRQRSTCPEVYAIGDVTGDGRDSVVEAVGQGATAARSIEHDLRATS